MLEVITLHVQRERGKVTGVGVHICICVCGPKKYFESYFSDRLTFSTSRQIYRLALPLQAPEMLSSSSKSRILHTLLYLSEG